MSEIQAWPLRVRQTLSFLGWVIQAEDGLELTDWSSDSYRIQNPLIEEERLKRVALAIGDRTGPCWCMTSDQLGDKSGPLWRRPDTGSFGDG